MKLRTHRWQRVVLGTTWVAFSPTLGPADAEQEMITIYCPPAVRTVYFGPGESEVPENMSAVMKDNSEAFLYVAREYGDDVVVVVGHTDDRESDITHSYLGLKRAEAIAKALVGVGVPAESLRVATCGKDLPICTESNEECRSRNRRVTFHRWEYDTPESHDEKTTLVRQVELACTSAKSTANKPVPAVRPEP